LNGQVNSRFGPYNGSMPRRSKTTRWLDAEEAAAWRAISFVMHRLTWALECQLERDADLSYIEYYTLVRLSEEPNHTLRMSGLAIVTNQSLSRLSHLVKRLETRGLLRRETDASDGRFTNAILMRSAPRSSDSSGRPRNASWPGSTAGRQVGRPRRSQMTLATRTGAARRSLHERSVSRRARGPRGSRDPVRRPRPGHPGAPARGRSERDVHRHRRLPPRGCSYMPKPINVTAIRARRRPPRGRGSRASE